MMQLTTEMWAEEQTYGKERATSARDKFYRSKISQEGCPGGMGGSGDHLQMPGA